MGLDMAGVDTGPRLSERRGRDRVALPRRPYVDRFTAGERPGAVLVQVGGNVFLRELAEGETILVKPPALLFKDPTVGMQMHVEFPHAGMKLWRTWGNRYLWLRLGAPAGWPFSRATTGWRTPEPTSGTAASSPSRVW